MFRMRAHREVETVFIEACACILLLVTNFVHDNRRIEAIHQSNLSHIFLFEPSMDVLIVK